MESTPNSRSVGIAHFFKHISIEIWLNSLEYKFLKKSTWNQPIPQSLKWWRESELITGVNIKFLIIQVRESMPGHLGQIQRP